GAGAGPRMERTLVRLATAMAQATVPEGTSSRMAMTAEASMVLRSAGRSVAQRRPLAAAPPGMEVWQSPLSEARRVAVVEGRILGWGVFRIYRRGVWRRVFRGGFFRARVGACAWGWRDGGRRVWTWVCAAWGLL